MGVWRIGSGIRGRVCERKKDGACETGENVEEIKINIV